MKHLLAVLTIAACGDDARQGVADALPGIDAEPCVTRVAHDNTVERVDGLVTWDGVCAAGMAMLSNGTVINACAIALDPSPSCGAPATCESRITYGATWLRAPNHPTDYDDIAGRVFWDGRCEAAGPDSRVTLSNGWQPYFSGGSSCAIAQRWTGCGGLYANPVAMFGCADPGVTFDGTQYIAACTSGNAMNAFALRVSPDLVTWTNAGHILPAAARPAWAVSDYWAPEIHKVGTKWVAYFSARQSNGRLAIGAASADAPLGPYTALPAPLLASASVGLIDAHQFGGYLLWKEDGNAQGDPTPIKARALAADGLSFANATVTTLITNDKPWEDNLVEGPWLTEHAGNFYLFYSGNAYYDGRYAIGVARAASVLGPYTKAADPIVVTTGMWIGPGHNSVVRGPGGDDYLVYHAWEMGHVNGAGDQRHLLVDQIQWDNGWPRALGAPSQTVRPRP